MRSMRRLTTRGWAHGAMGVRAKACHGRPSGLVRADICARWDGSVAVARRPARLGDAWAVNGRAARGGVRGYAVVRRVRLSLFRCREDLFGCRDRFSVRRNTLNVAKILRAEMGKWRFKKSAANSGDVLRVPVVMYGRVENADSLIVEAAD